MRIGPSYLVMSFSDWYYIYPLVWFSSASQLVIAFKFSRNLNTAFWSPYQSEKDITRYEVFY
jgi:hypothetical protein